eukprot:m.126178 g.126178  ORF g.126178 m.126178 type:complete len:249 (-) comp29184_c2_seq2:460-1206(-)
MCSRWGLVNTCRIAVCHGAKHVKGRSHEFRSMTSGFTWSMYTTTINTRPLATLSTKSKPKVLFVLGGPGSGKGTQCGLMVEKYGCLHLSAGDLLRAERNTGSDVAQLINNYIAEGAIVPGHITTGLLKKAILGSSNEIVLVDGFPRDKGNVDNWDQLVGDDADVCAVLLFECSEEELTKRILKRSETSGRIDDNIDTLTKRFATFREQTKPVVEKYASSGLVQRIDGARPIETVFEDVQKILEAALHD